MQGLCKFGFYEVFKILYSDMLGEVGTKLQYNPVKSDLWGGGKNLSESKYPKS